MYKCKCISGLQKCYLLTYYLGPWAAPQALNYATHAKSELNTIRLTYRQQQHTVNMQILLAVPSSASVIKLISNVFHTYIEEAILSIIPLW